MLCLLLSFGQIWKEARSEHFFQGVDIDLEDLANNTKQNLAWWVKSKPDIAPTNYSTWCRTYKESMTVGDICRALKRRTWEEDSLIWHTDGSWDVGDLEALQLVGLIMWPKCFGGFYDWEL